MTAKKLLLASNGGYLIEEGYKLLGIPKSEMRIGYVTTASKGSRNLDYLVWHREALVKNGYAFEEVDIEGRNEAELLEIFSDKNIIHVEGGNTFYLLKAIRESGFDRAIKTLTARGVIYAGSSAGAYIACPTIEMATWKRPGEEKDNFGMTDLTALGLIPFLIKAHYNPKDEELIREKVCASRYPTRILKDGQAILVEGDSYKFVGEGEEVRL